MVRKCRRSSLPDEVSGIRDMGKNRLGTMYDASCLVIAPTIVWQMEPKSVSMARIRVSSFSDGERQKKTANTFVCPRATSSTDD